MNFRPFRPLSTRVSVIGFGTWAMGGESTLGGKQLGWGQTDRAEAERAVRSAVAHGINFFDTADVYGNGTSETLLGEWLHDDKDVLVCTKFGNREDGAGKGFQDFSARWLAESVEGSLRRLRRERLDVLLLHSPPDDFDWSRYDPAPFLALRNQGKIGCFGVSCRSVKGAQSVLRARFGSVLEIIYNAVDRRAEDTVLGDAALAEVGVIARVPLASGFLSGGYGDKPESFAATDYRSTLAPEEVQWRAHSSHQLGFLDALPGGMAVSALRFCLSRPEVATVIPGMRRVAHVEKNLLASEYGPLEPAVSSAIRAAVPRVYKGWEV